MGPTIITGMYALWHSLSLLTVGVRQDLDLERKGLNALKFDTVQVKEANPSKSNNLHPRREDSNFKEKRFPQ
jgi:hypothetical protein